MSVEVGGMFTKSVRSMRGSAIVTTDAPSGILVSLNVLSKFLAACAGTIISGIFVASVAEERVNGDNLVGVGWVITLVIVLSDSSVLLSAIFGLTPSCVYLSHRSSLFV